MTEQHYKILLLGETGSGKTTTIASLPSYVAFPTWEEAMKTKDLDVLAPVNFFLDLEGNGGAERVHVGIRHADNERVEDGESRTIAPKMIVFRHEQNHFHFLDVPGTGDTDGLEQDLENSAKIVEAIRALDEVHMIVIVMNSTMTRISHHFRHCMSEALAKLHRANLPQVAFLFTMTRGNEYKPGEAIVIVRQFLTNINADAPIQLPLTIDNCFCMDNTAFRVLCAAVQNPRVRQMDLKRFERDWTVSRRAVMRLLQEIPKRRPEPTLSLTSVNDARKAILCLYPVLAKVCSTVEANRARLAAEPERAADEIVSQGGTEDYVIEELPLTQPITVCTSLKCRKEVPLAPGHSEKTIIYPQVCHRKCYQTKIEVSRTGHPELQKCCVFYVNVDVAAAQEGQVQGEGDCLVCKCSYREHQHVRVERRLAVRREFVAPRTATHARTFVEQRTQELQREYEAIVDVVKQCSAFLRNNAVLGFNTAFLDLLQEEIRR